MKLELQDIGFLGQKLLRQGIPPPLIGPHHSVDDMNFIQGCSLLQVHSIAQLKPQNATSMYFIMYDEIILITSWVTNYILISAE